MTGPSAGSRLARPGLAGVLALGLLLTSVQTALAGPPPAPEPAPAPAPDGAGPGTVSRDLPPPPRDPDDAPFMPAPRGQPGQFSTPDPHDPITRPYSTRRRLQLTAMPLYAAFRAPLIGRPDEPIRGGGASVEVDTRLLRWLWLRVQVSHTEHPVSAVDQVNEEDGEVTRLANAGRLSASSAGLGLVYPLDLGRFLPLIDVGVDALYIRSPEAAIDGQLGGECRAGGVCDFGLTCGADLTCQPTLLPALHAGIGVDVLLGRRWALGAHVRYHALLSEPAVFPVYLLGALRLAVRF